MSRWILVNRKTGKPSGLRFSYPSAERARDFAEDHEEPARVEVVSRSGPFSDHCRLDAAQARSGDAKKGDPV